MKDRSDRRNVTRREFLQASATAGLAGVTLPQAFAQEAKTSAGEIPRRTLGRTGLKMGIIGLGGFHMANPANVEDSIRLVRTAIDSGINFLDNCWDYHGGDSEVRMGKALKDGYRQRAFLMTKIDGRTKAAATSQIEESLRRLQTDHIDLMQIHEVIRTTDPDRVFGTGGTMEALLEAKKAGKIRFIGFTGHKSPEIHLLMLETAFKHQFTFDTVQLPLNVMDAHYDSFEKKVIPVLRKHNIGVLGMKPLGGGMILDSKTVSATDCLRYALSLQTDVVITGMDDMDKLNQSLSVARNFKPLNQKEIAAMLDKTRTAAMAGEFEKYKISNRFDGTVRNPQWLG